MGTELSRMPVQVESESESESVEQEELLAPAPAWPSPVRQPAVGAMTVGAADDPAEHAADRLADHALSRLHAGHALPSHAAAPTGTVQRSVVAGGGQEGGALDDGTAAQIASRTGGGRSMDEPVRRRMEGAFGQSFSSVRLHDDRDAADLSSSISAQAFTTGKDVFLGSGIDTSSPAGERVLAHELAHVVQNGGGAPIHRWFGKKKVEAPKPPPAAALAAPAPILAARKPPAPDAGAGAPKAAVPAKKEPQVVKGDEGLDPDMAKAFAAARKVDYTYETDEVRTQAWVPKKQQKAIADVSSWSKRAGGDADKRTLKDLLRAYIMRDYLGIIATRAIKQPHLTGEGELRAPHPAEKAAMEAKYYPKTLENRDKQKGLIDLGPYAPETQGWLRQAGFAAAIPQTPEQKADKAGGPKLDVRSTFIGSKSVMRPDRMHLFIVYTSSEGEQTFFRGGPGEGGFTSCSVGDYVPKTIDWDPSAPTVTVATGPKAVQALEKMHRTAEIINSMQVPYVGNTVKANAGGLGGLEALITGENCNATVWTLLDKAGVEKKKPTGLHPGWGHKLGAVLSPDKVGALDAPEATNGGLPGRLAGGKSKTVQVYVDRRKAEKLMPLEGGSQVVVVKKVDNGKMVQIRLADGKTTGFIVSEDLYVEPKARPIWVDGPPGFTSPITDEGGRTLCYAEGSDPILILDESWLPGDTEGDYKVRYQHPEDGQVEGYMRGMYLTALAPGTVVPDDDDDDDDEYEAEE